MTDTSTERQDHLDCAHGLMILHMMFYHLCGSTLFNTPYYYPVIHPLSFFMTWFFFKSGMLYKERKISEVFIRGLKRLLIPAIIFSAIGIVCHLIANQPKTCFSEEIEYAYLIGAFRGNGPIWFLFSLFAIQVLYSFIQKIKLNPALVALFSLGWLFINKYLGLRPIWVYNIPLGLMFYSLGHFFKDIQYSRLVIICSIIVYFVLYFVHTQIDFLFGLFKPFVITIPWVLAGSILTNILFKSFPKICIAPLRFYARHSMEFLCTHMLVFTILEGYLKYHTLNISAQLFIFIVFIVYFTILSLILHFFKLKHIQWMFGR